nr:serine hydrolase domain-containing protein [Sabulibacter ruber]
MIPLFLLISQVGLGQMRTFSGKPIGAAEFEKRIRKAMDSLQVPGMSIAVINGGKVVYARGFGFSNTESKKEVTASTVFEAASLSKPVFAFFALKLAKEGRLDIDKPLVDYLAADNIDDERYRRITARMVLGHTTGLPNWGDGEKLRLLSEPGERFSYSGEAYVYLARVLAKLCGTSLKGLEGIFQREVAEDLKPNGLHFVLTEGIRQNLAGGYQKGQPVSDERDRTVFDPAGGLYSNVPSYAAFLVGLMQQQKRYREMFVPFVSLEESSPIREYFGVESWTLGLAVVKIGGKENFWHGGNNLGYTSSFMVNPAKRFGYVYFTNEDQCNGMKKVVESILWD